MKKRHIKLAEKNAAENIKLKKASLESHQSALERLKEFLLLDQLPSRIEVYDNSHTFGKESVGVMIVIDQEGFSSKNYRKFNIRYDESYQGKSQVDDYYMMKEVLLRRLRKINKNSDALLPDVIIIDGGRGQLNVAKQVVLENNITSITLMSISKGKERNAGREIIHMLKKDKVLKPNDPLLFFIQRIRDEAHRFALAYHRKRRSMRDFQSELDDISGIGEKRKKRLLRNFGSVANIRRATVEELAPFLGSKLARRVKEALNP